MSVSSAPSSPPLPPLPPVKKPALTPFFLQDPVHPRMRWERYRQWTGGEWIWMVLWKFQTHVPIKDAAYATKIAISLATQDYPDLGCIQSSHLIWCRDFISRLVEEGRLSVEPGSEGERLGELGKLIGEREERGRMLEAQRAAEQLESTSESEEDEEVNDGQDVGPDGRPLPPDELDELMHQAAMEGTIMRCQRCVRCSSKWS